MSSFPTNMMRMSCLVLSAVRLQFRRVMDSLLPFYALPIATLQERLAEVESIQETFTLIVQNGKVELQWNDDYSRDQWWASRPRADSQINLMGPFLGMLGDFRSAKIQACEVP